jgi:hypothetical protein
MFKYLLEVKDSLLITYTKQVYRHIHYMTLNEMSASSQTHVLSCRCSNFFEKNVLIFCT